MAFAGIKRVISNIKCGKAKKAGKLMDIMLYPEGCHGFVTKNAAEKPQQYRLREDCFWY